jgi:Holliday junction DNA helicase RuvA
VISTVRGTLLEKKPTSLSVEVNGLGYTLHVPLSTYESVGNVGESVRLYTHLRVREDTIELFGFAKEEERSLFLLLLSVTGIGPKAALNILSSSRPGALHEAIGTGNESVLMAIPGIGKKMAARLVVELREKLAALAPPVTGPQPTGPPLDAKVFEDAVAALTSLGYSRQSAVKAVQKAQDSLEGEKDLEVLVRTALRFARS